MQHTVRVNEVPRDHSLGVDIPGDSALAGTLARSWSIEFGELARGAAQEAVTRAVWIQIIPRDCQRRVHAIGERTLAARGIELGERAIWSAQIPVVHVAGVNVPTLD